jgi:hypothetical protein
MIFQTGSKRNAPIDGRKIGNTIAIQNHKSDTISIKFGKFFGNSPLMRWGFSARERS